ncbi:Twin-arginine translocation pathway signal (fragment) [Candidatus Terasakiella magnetica]|uniref:Twin-arginine translocation pathway signal n=1 Tax=Candidatus Terasakiella magnetica TaxID=1867952 RepID=A0A1C3RI30_9PROT
MLTRRNVLKIAIGGAAALSLPSLVHARHKPILIGDINSYIPSINRFTLPYRKGWTLALEQVNISGGINNKPIEVLSQNDKGRPSEAVNAARFLVEQKGVDILSGTFLSNVGLAVSKYAHQSQIPFIAAEPLSDELTLEQGNPYTFRLRPSTYTQAHMLAKEAAKLPVGRWACIAPDYEYGRSAVENFKSFINKARPDVEFIHDEWVELFNINPEKVINNLSNKNIDALFNVTFSSDLEKLITQAEKSDFFKDKSVVSLLTGEPEYLNRITSPACDNWIVTGYPWDQIQTHAHKEFVKKYLARFEEPPMLGSLVGYMTLLSIASAYKQHKEEDKNDLHRHFEGLYFDRPLGMVHFRKSDHQSSMGAFIGRLRHHEGKNIMTDWYYADGPEFWPTEAVIKERRPQI